MDALSDADCLAHSPSEPTAFSYRNRLLHNYSAQGIVFIHGPENAALHLEVDTDGNVFLHRESFVRDVEQAFNAFVSDVRGDATLRGRTLAHLRCFPPMGLALIVPESS